jgi:membrane-associated HD superfamily phosphohydrolase
VDLALKNGLNQQIIDVIQQHHGTSMIYYFYKRAHSSRRISAPAERS